jgi:hypothetical protein
MVTKLLALCGVVLGATALLAASPAGAGVPTPVTLHESITFGTDHMPPVGVFTAEGLPRCGSGTFGDQVVNFNLGGHALVVDRTYTCDGGAGSLTARMVLHISPVDENGDASISGQWTIHGGTGSLAGAHGTGTTSGVNSGCAPIGSLFPACQTGVGTVTASIN